MAPFKSVPRLFLLHDKTRIHSFLFGIRHAFRLRPGLRPQRDARIAR